MYSSSSFGPFTLILLSPREFPSLTNFEKVNSKETVLDLSFPKILDQVNWTLSKNSIRDGSKGDVLTGWKGGRLVRDKRRRRTKRESVVLYKLNRTLVQHQVSRSASPSHFCPSCSSLLSQNGKGEVAWPQLEFRTRPIPMRETMLTDERTRPRCNNNAGPGKENRGEKTMGAH